MNANDVSGGVACRRPALALDLESVLVPEIWIEVARISQVHSLALTTRDIPDYGQLMRRRILLCRKHALTLRKLQAIVEGMAPFTGAVEFLRWAAARAEVSIISDTFMELASPLIQKLGSYQVHCHTLEMNGDGYISHHHSERSPSKADRVREMKRQGLHVTAVGDSYNDVPMFEASDGAILFNPAAALSTLAGKFSVASNLDELKVHLEQVWKTSLQAPILSTPKARS